NTLQTNYDELQSTYNTLQTNYDELQSTYNELLENYNNAYDEGYLTGVNKAYSNNPFYQATLSYYFNLEAATPGYTGVIGDSYLQGNTYLKPYEFFQSLYTSEDLRPYTEETQLSYFKLELAKAYPLSSLVLDIQTNLANDFNYYFVFTFTDGSTYIFSNNQTSDIYRSFVIDLTQEANLQDKLVSSITWRRQYLYDVNILSLDGYFTGYADGRSDGYTSGYNKGIDEGYDNGVEDGTTTGYQNGYNTGYTEGTQASNYLRNVVFAIADTPIRVFKQVFGFEILGINIAGIVLSLMSLMVVIYLYKVFKG
ncbi:MAG: hypothetical protein K6E99_03815, partial [Bacilli bacterium]|nr:hypothetical protein [Bacilli bacterium]